MLNGISKEALIRNELGVHARSAAGMVRISQQARSNVWMIRDDEKVDAKSVIDILTLACQKGTRVTIKIDDPADIDILNGIIALIENNFGE